MKALLVILCLCNLTALYSQPARRNDVIINEIMMDPDPAVGLPTVEYVELYNRSGLTVNLSGWRLVTAALTSSLLPAYQLPPDSFVVLCRRSDSVSFFNGLALSGFPSLSNESGQLSLLNSSGVLVNAARYDRNSFGDAPKNNGGWSLELIDPSMSCLLTENWAFSTSSSGGSPGRRNSLSTSLPPPALKLENWWMIGAEELHLEFNKSLDSVTARDTRKWIGKTSPTIHSISLAEPFLNEVVIRFRTGILPGLHLLEHTGLSDLCGGNSEPLALTIGYAEMPRDGDIRFNELYFDPQPGGSDYFELYHAGKKPLNLADLNIQYRKSSGGYSESIPLSNTPAYILPGSYYVFSSDPDFVKNQFNCPKPEWLRKAGSMPSMPNEGGTLVLRNRRLEKIDSVIYDPDMHFALLDDPEGVALERISQDPPSWERSNWTSASAGSGGGSPTAPNSQSRAENESEPDISIIPAVISPNRDGIDDFSSVSYRSSQPGQVASLLVFNLAGEELRSITRRQLIGTKSQWIFDGFDSKGQLLPRGHYILWLELFNLQGKVRRIKKAVLII